MSTPDLHATPVPYWRLSGFYFFYFALLGALVPFWSLYLQHLSFDAAEIGIVMAALAGSRIVAPNLWGWLADKTGRRLTIIRTGSLLAALCFTAMLWQQSFNWVLFVVLLFSFFWNAVLSQFEVLTLHYLDKKAHDYSKIRLWGSVGFIVAVVLLGWLFERFSIALLPWCMLAILLAIWLSSLLIKSPPPSGNKAQVLELNANLLQVLAKPVVICFFAACLLLQLSHGSYYTFYSVYLESYGYSRQLIGLLWALGVVAEVAIFLLMPRLLPLHGAKKLFAWALLLTVGRWLMIAYYPESLTMLLLAQLLHAFSFGVAHAVAVEWVRRYFPAGLQGQGQALYSAVSFGIGGALGAVISGYTWTLGPAFSFGLCALAALVGFLVVLFGVNEDAADVA